ncbi:hypothetical protein [Flavobacterium covae]|uniref:hypothetical protein n=1 Tax=Flavobacterium covae TaxID=2906076 RepID=UPI000745B7A0|nr:hypothetical protein [Flavobacterium covae]AMA49439.1 hypothetical protein AWN65_08200 [Flavobacterium covae]MCJ1808954.1 hypothetical protein [Flavobacterium covae]
MDSIDFSQWLKESFNFDSNLNVLFKNALEESFRVFANSSFNGIPFFDYYKDNLYQELKRHYVGHLELLIGQIPEPHSRVSLKILNIPLNDYYRQKKELLQQVSLLKS